MIGSKAFFPSKEREFLLDMTVQYFETVIKTVHFLMQYLFTVVHFCIIINIHLKFMDECRKESLYHHFLQNEIFFTHSL